MPPLLDMVADGALATFSFTIQAVEAVHREIIKHASPDSLKKLRTPRELKHKGIEEKGKATACDLEEAKAKLDALLFLARAVCATGPDCGLYWQPDGVEDGVRRCREQNIPLCGWIAGQPVQRRIALLSSDPSQLNRNALTKLLLEPGVLQHQGDLLISILENLFSKPVDCTVAGHALNEIWAQMAGLRSPMKHSVRGWRISLCCGSLQSRRRSRASQAMTRSQAAG